MSGRGHDPWSFATSSGSGDPELLSYLGGRIHQQGEKNWAEGGCCRTQDPTGADIPAGGLGMAQSLVWLEGSGVGDESEQAGAMQVQVPVGFVVNGESSEGFT